MPNGSKKLNYFFSKNIFLGSFINVDDIPKQNLPEFCFVGRSNVGKSSIINAIAKTKNLAKTSKKPGLTKFANLFEINNSLNIVDLPGYGYAKVSKTTRHKLSNLVESYICNRYNIFKTFVLIDCKIGIKNSDIDMFDFIVSNNKSFSILLTKIDKCSENLINKQKSSINTLMKNYKNNFDKIITTSSKKNEGVLEIQKEIFNLSQKQ